MILRRTRTGLRLSQHGVVVCELRTTPGPTHSVFDVLAALLHQLGPAAVGRAGLLGFSAGGMMAPLAALGSTPRLEAVDLDRDAHRLFAQNCPGWSSRVAWQHDDARAWLERQPGGFDLLVEDLSVPVDGDVVKPELCWTTLPDLIRGRLASGGVAVFNLLPPAPGGWAHQLTRLRRRFGSARVIELEEFENRIVVAGRNVPPARELGRRLRLDLRRLRSRQAGRLRVRTVG